MDGCGQPSAIENFIAHAVHMYTLYMYAPQVSHSLTRSLSVPVSGDSNALMMLSSASACARVTVPLCPLPPPVVPAAAAAAEAVFFSPRAAQPFVPRNASSASIAVSEAPSSSDVAAAAAADVDDDDVVVDDDGNASDVAVVVPGEAMRRSRRSMDSGSEGEGVDVVMWLLFVVCGACAG